MKNVTEGRGVKDFLTLFKLIRKGQEHYLLADSEGGPGGRKGKETVKVRNRQATPFWNRC